MESSEKKTVSIYCDEKVWRDWQSTAEELGLSASSMFELTARIINDVFNDRGLSGLVELVSKLSEASKKKKSK